MIIALVILLDTGSNPVYLQKRVGKNNRDFTLFKFRTMHKYADIEGLLTVGNNDRRITKTGMWLRKNKLDELPQLLNILLGKMSFVGPRPEVRKYVNLYSREQKQVLTVRPGLTDYASLEYINENEILSKYENPEKAYVEIIMPAKLKLNLKYIENNSLLTDLKIILSTVLGIFR